MAGGFEGLDKGRLEQSVKRVLMEAKEEIENRRRTVQTAITNEIGPQKAWNGPDADQFASDWSQADVKLGNVVTTLDTAITKIAESITQQDQASAAATGGFQVL